MEGDKSIVVLGIDAHKRTHTVVAVDEAGRQVGVRVTEATSTAANSTVESGSWWSAPTAAADTPAATPDTER